MKTCAFTGHRPQHLPFGMNENDERCTDLKETLKEQIINLIETEDVTHFITGMALGIDLYAAELVLDLKARYPSITLESAIPCETQAVKWSAAQRERYYDIAAQCDKVDRAMRIAFLNLPTTQRCCTHSCWTEPVFPRSTATPKRTVLSGCISP